MKKIILLFPVLFLCLAGFAQTVNWLQPSDHWYFHIQSGWVGAGIEHLWVKAADTMVAGKTYRIMERKAEFSPSGVVQSSRRLVRQDGKAIYAIPWSGGQEVLLYNFDLPVGDTIMVPTAFGGEIGYIVESVETIQINGQSRLKQEVTWLKGNTTFSATKGSLIEGIGNVEGLHLIGGEWCLSESYFFVDEPGTVVVDGETRTFCSFENDQIHFEGLGQTFCAALGTDAPNIDNVAIYPNPSAGTLRISSENGPQTFRVDLFDAAGRLILMQSIDGAGEIVTAYKGVATVVLRAENGVSYKKVVFY